MLALFYYMLVTFDYMGKLGYMMGFATFKLSSILHLKYFQVWH